MAMRYLREENVRLDLFAKYDDPQRLHYVAMITEMDLSHIIFLHTQETFRNGLLEKHLLSQCDLALGIFGTSQKARNVIPNKIIDAFAMGLPVLTMDAPGIKELIDPQKDLFVCENAPASIGKAIKEIMRVPEERKRRAKAGHENFLKTFHPEKYSRSVLSIIDDVCNTSSNRRGQ
jgi:glycosyltransferase involved in cell wall biosynthesis